MATDMNGVVMGPPPVGIPHFKIPFALGGNGSAQTVLQDSTEEVTQSVANLVGTRPGTRLMVPTYGTPDPTFGGVSAPALQLSVAKWEKRAVVNVQTAPGSNEVVSVSVDSVGP